MTTNTTESPSAATSTRFVQIPVAIIDDPRLKAVDVRVASIIARWLDRDGQGWALNDVIAQSASVSARTVQQSLRRLEAAGWIRCDPSADRGRRRITAINWPSHRPPPQGREGEADCAPEPLRVKHAAPSRAKQAAPKLYRRSYSDIVVVPESPPPPVPSARGREREATAEATAPSRQVLIASGEARAAAPVHQPVVGRTGGVAAGGPGDAASGSEPDPPEVAEAIAEAERVFGSDQQMRSRVLGLLRSVPSAKPEWVTAATRKAEDAKGRNPSKVYTWGYVRTVVQRWVGEGGPPPKAKASKASRPQAEQPAGYEPLTQPWCEIQMCTGLREAIAKRWRVTAEGMRQGAAEWVERMIGVYGPDLRRQELFRTVAECAHDRVLQWYATYTLIRSAPRDIATADEAPTRATMRASGEALMDILVAPEALRNTLSELVDTAYQRARILAREGNLESYGANQWEDLWREMSGNRRARPKEQYVTAPPDWDDYWEENRTASKPAALSVPVDDENGVWGVIKKIKADKAAKAAKVALSEPLAELNEHQLDWVASLNAERREALNRHPQRDRILRWFTHGPNRCLEGEAFHILDRLIELEADLPQNA